LIPKQHIDSLSDCTAAHAPLLGKMLALAPQLAAEHGIGVKVDAQGNRSGGYKTLFNVGPNGGQEVYHLHLHVYGGPRPWRGLGT
jgi:histidine triad (HIT) family protein